MVDEAPNRSVNRVDDTILRYADSRSPEEISVLLRGAIGAKAVAARAQVLLESRHWLTVAQEEQVVLQKMRDLLMEIEKVPFQDDKMFGLRIKAIKEIGVLVDKRSKTLNVDLDHYDVNVGREMARVYDIALSFMKGALREEIDPGKWDSIATEALAHAQLEVMKKAVEE